MTNTAPRRLTQGKATVPHCLYHVDLTVTESSSPLGFSTTGGGGWEVWDRFITLDGKPAYHIGNICGTCAFFFERLSGANQSVDATSVAETLNTHQGLPESLPVDELSNLLPQGCYKALVLEVAPALVELGSREDYFRHEQVETWGMDPFWGLHHNPKTQYYRTLTTSLDASSRLYEFVVPMFPQTWLDHTRVEQYATAFQAGRSACAVALSVLDVKQPVDREPSWAHWCLAHYLIDGHHKVFAAARTRSKLKLLAFLAPDHGVSRIDDAERLVEFLSA